MQNVSNWTTLNECGEQNPVSTRRRGSKSPLLLAVFPLCTFGFFSLDIPSLFYLLYILSLPQPNGTFISFVTVSGKLLKSTSYRPTPHARWIDILWTPASSCISKSQQSDSLILSLFFIFSFFLFSGNSVALYNYTTIYRTSVPLGIAVLTPWDAPVSSLLLV